MIMASLRKFTFVRGEVKVLGIEDQEYCEMFEENCKRKGLLGMMGESVLALLKFCYLQGSRINRGLVKLYCFQICYFFSLFKYIYPAILGS